MQGVSYRGPGIDEIIQETVRQCSENEAMETSFQVVSSKGVRIDISPEDDNADVRTKKALLLA